jgi:hypothetical protein
VLIGKMLGNVRREQHEIRAGLISRFVLSANTVFQLRKVVFPA